MTHGDIWSRHEGNQGTGQAEHNRRKPDCGHKDGSEERDKEQKRNVCVPNDDQKEKKKDPNAMEIGSAKVKWRFESDSVFGGPKEDDAEEKDISPWKVF